MAKKKQRIKELTKLSIFLAEQLPPEILSAVFTKFYGKDVFEHSWSRPSPPLILYFPEGENIEAKAIAWADSRRDEEKLSAQAQEEVRLGLQA